MEDDDKKRVDSGEGLEASSSNAIWQESNGDQRDGADGRRNNEREEAKNNHQVVDHHNDFLVTEEDGHISEMSQTFLIEHTKNHITERTNEDSSLC